MNPTPYRPPRSGENLSPFKKKAAKKKASKKAGPKKKGY